MLFRDGDLPGRGRRHLPQGARSSAPPLGVDAAGSRPRAASCIRLDRYLLDKSRGSLVRWRRGDLGCAEVASQRTGVLARAAGRGRPGRDSRGRPAGRSGALRDCRWSSRARSACIPRPPAARPSRAPFRHPVSSSSAVMKASSHSSFSSRYVKSPIDRPSTLRDETQFLATGPKTCWLRCVVVLGRREAGFVVG